MLQTDKMNEKLDYNLNEAEILQISNDAYFYFAYKEPCLDEDNYDEIQELKARFKYGFKFDEQYEASFVEDSDLIECMLIPICKCNTPFTHFRIDGKWFKSEFFYSSDKKQAYYRIYNMYDGRFQDYGWNDVIINQYGKPEIRPNKCIFPLWGKNWTKY